MAYRSTNRSNIFFTLSNGVVLSLLFRAELQRILPNQQQIIATVGALLLSGLAFLGPAAWRVWPIQNILCAFVWPFLWLEPYKYHACSTHRTSTLGVGSLRYCDGGTPIDWPGKRHIGYYTPPQGNVATTSAAAFLIRQKRIIGGGGTFVAVVQLSPAYYLFDNEAREELLYILTERSQQKIWSKYSAQVGICFSISC